MITKEQTKDFIARAYDIAVKHGFHDQSLSVGHCMMLVLSEISEAVEADRRGRYANIPKERENTIFDPCVFHKDNVHYVDTFKENIKDTVEDELADVAIRLFDLCGTLNITPTDRFESYRELFKDFRKNYQRHSFCERAFVLSAILCHADGASVTDDGSGKSLPDIIGAALFFLFAMAEDMNVDFIRHIELKMEYNETRPKKHGKKY